MIELFFSRDLCVNLGMYLCIKLYKEDYMAEKQKEALFKSKGERESIRKVIHLMAISKMKKIRISGL